MLLKHVEESSLLNFKLVVVGHVDHGKSTIIGRMLYETGKLSDQKIKEIKAYCDKRSMPFEWSFVLDSFQAEREQGITIDTTHINFHYNHLNFTFIDVPGHKEFMKNMVSGASLADAVILVVDAHEGIQEQTKNHSHILKLLGLKNLIVLVNKVDLIDYDQKKFEKIKKEITQFTDQLGIELKACIPIAAKDGINLFEKSDKMPWYEDSALIDAIQKLSVQKMSEVKHLRLSVQDVYKFDQKNRYIVGRILGGSLQKGDEVCFSPSNKTAVVTKIDAWNKGELQIAYEGQSVAFQIDKPLFIERGEVMSHTKDMPVISDVFRLNFFWLDDASLKADDKLVMRIGTNEASCFVESIDWIENAEGRITDRQEIQKNELAEGVFRLKKPVAFDDEESSLTLHRVALVRDDVLVGAGIIDRKGFPDLRGAFHQKSTNIFKVDHAVTHAERVNKNNHEAAILWMTGLSGSGKSTLAMALESALFKKGYQTYVLDGDNVRHGLNADLGFSPEDRVENIRRIGQVAKLFADAGHIVITSFISPYLSDRQRAREIMPNHFHEIHLSTSLDVCETRDPKDLYKKARKGEIKEFTGIDSPYERPINAEIVINTGELSVEDSVEKLLDYVIQKVKLN